MLDRRDFLAATSAAAAGTLLAGRLEAAEFKTKLHKSLIGTPNEETLSKWKAAGFEGIESSVREASPEDAAKARRTAEKLGMRIHSLLRGWMNFNEPSKVEADVASVVRSIETAGGYGADAILLVPCRLGGVPMPEPWEFDIDFDPKTGHVRLVVQGDNSRYQKYIEAQNYATDSSREAVRKLIPAAEKAKVVIALENVWNNLWVLPELAANFIASFDSPWVKAYFDIGNHVKYARPERWIKALGKQIVKCHVKDFKLNPDGHGGKFVDPRDGSIDWPAVRQALDEVGYNGWMTIEGSEKLPLDERNKRLDLIIAGK